MLVRLRTELKKKKKHDEDLEFDQFEFQAPSHSLSLRVLHDAPQVKWVWYESLECHAMLSMLRWIPKSHQPCGCREHPRNSAERHAQPDLPMQKRSTQQLNRFNKPILICYSKIGKLVPQLLQNTLNVCIHEKSFTDLYRPTELCLANVSVQDQCCSACTTSPQDILCNRYTCHLRAGLLFWMSVNIEYNQTLCTHCTRSRHRAVQSKNWGSFSF